MAIVQFVRSVYAVMHGRTAGSFAPYPRPEGRSDSHAVSVDRAGSAVDGARGRSGSAAVQGQPQFEQTAFERWTVEEDPFFARGVGCQAWRTVGACRQDAQAC